MLNEKIFKQNIAILSENFNFQPTSEWMKLIFRSINDKTSDQIFKHRIGEILFTKKSSEWNKDFGFGGKPALADCLEMFCVKRKEVACKQYVEFGNYRSTRLESYADALKRTSILIDKISQKQIEV